jgi:glutamyl-tRNA synthetase
LLHLGHARSFLLAWWSARSRQGRVLLRFDDLDGQRSQPQFATQAQIDLEWLGLDWDGAPVFQSSHQAAFDGAIRRLLESDACYPCICSRRDVEEAIAAPHAPPSEPRYPGTCRGRFSTVAQARSETGRDPCLRFRVVPGEVQFNDGLFGEQRYDVQDTIGDFVVQRRDGSIAYQLAVVIDDAEQGVTEVVRGEDLLPSTARQVLLQRALQLPHPRWIHVPLVNDSTGKRLAKRSDSLSLQTLRDSGIDARAVVAWAATSAGLAVPRRSTAREVLSVFDWSQVHRKAVDLAENPLVALR